MCIHVYFVCFLITLQLNFVKANFIKTNNSVLNLGFLILTKIQLFKEYMSDSFTNYNYVGNTKVSVSIKKTYANKCTLSEIFLTEILKSFSVF